MDILSVLIFFLGCFIFTFIERHTQIPFVKWVFIIPFCLIIANRRLDVPDTDIYLNYFLSEDSSLLSYVDFGFEAGFQTLSKIFKFFADENYTLYFGLITLTNLLVIDWALNRIRKFFYQEQNAINGDFDSSRPLDFAKNMVYSILPLTLYIAYFGIYVNAIVLRVGIAFSLIVFASSFAVKEYKRLTDYVIIVLLLILAYLFHATALIGILILLIILFSKQLSIKTYIWIFAITGVVYFSNLTSRLGSSVFGFISSLNNLTLLSTKLSGYEGDSSMFISEGISMKFVFFWMMSFVLIRNVSLSKLYYKYLHVYLAGLAVFAVFRSVLLVERVTDYFLLFSVVLFYLFLIKQINIKFWVYYIIIIILQLTFVLRITNVELL